MSSPSSPSPYPWQDRRRRRFFRPIALRRVLLGVFGILCIALLWFFAPLISRTMSSHDVVTMGEAITERVKTIEKGAQLGQKALEIGNSGVGILQKTWERAWGTLSTRSGPTVKTSDGIPSIQENLNPSFGLPIYGTMEKKKNESSTADVASPHSVPIYGDTETETKSIPRIRLIAWGDIDGDGDTDTVVVEEEKDQIVWYDKINTAVQQRYVIAGTSRGITKIQIIDFDQDGDNDVIAFVEGIGEMWYENNGAHPPSWIGKMHKKP